MASFYSKSTKMELTLKIGLRLGFPNINPTKMLYPDNKSQTIFRVRIFCFESPKIGTEISIGNILEISLEDFDLEVRINFILKLTESERTRSTYSCTVRELPLGEDSIPYSCRG